MNNSCQQLHETVVRDILDVIHDVKDFDQVDWLTNRGNVGSIAKRASNLTLVFPVICSTNISIQTAAVITKAIERKCVSLLQILFSSMQLTSVDNMYDYLKQFHVNLDARKGVNLDDFMDIMDTMVKEGAVTVTDYDIYNAVREDMKNINYYLKETYNPVSINDYKIRTSYYGESHVVCEADTAPTAGYDATTWSKMTDDQKLNAFQRYGKKVDNMGKQIADSIGKAAATAASAAIRDNMRDVSKPSKDHIEYFKNQLSTGEVVKANELMPTTMIVNFTSNIDGQFHTTTGVIGVKAKLYPVDSMDIINRLASKYSDSHGLFSLVRASTREISFFRDLAFAIDKAKFDAVTMAKDSNNSRLFRVLERRAAKNRFSALLKKNDASPITSLVLSQEEVEYLKKYHTIDMDRPAVTKKFLDNFNLMDIVIADESLEVARFLFDDGDGVYEVLPYDALEKEAKDSSYKKVVNLMSKVAR